MSDFSCFGLLRSKITGNELPFTCCGNCRQKIFFLRNNFTNVVVIVVYETLKPRNVKDRNRNTCKREVP
jgi:cytidine deaminase